jgi:hypothetical protein
MGIDRDLLFNRPMEASIDRCSVLGNVR